jgi:hypothetical protein
MLRKFNPKVLYIISHTYLNARGHCVVTSTHNTSVSHDLPLDQDIHPIPVKEGNSKGSAFCIVSSTQVARQVIAELDGKYTIPGFGGIAPVNVKVSFLMIHLLCFCPPFSFRLRKMIRRS